MSVQDGRGSVDVGASAAQFVELAPAAHRDDRVYEVLSHVVAETLATRRAEI